MPKLQDISVLPSDAVDLLEAVGYLDVTEFVEADPVDLQSELAGANKKLRIIEDDPTAEDIGQWQKSAANYDGETLPVEEEVASEVEPEKEENVDEQQEVESDDVAPAYVNFENDPEVLEMLALSPEALTLDPSLIRRHKLKVPDIPEGILLTHCQGEVEINVMTTERMAKSQKRESEIKRTGLMASRIRNFDEARDDEHHVKPLDRGKPKDAVSLSEGLNKGIDPGSRRFVRGVLHPDPWSVRRSAFFALLVQILLAANLICIPWLLFYEDMLWWVIGLISGLFVSALFYLFWGISARCRVCGQRQFAPKKCLKNKKAHHIPLIGYIFPTALHSIFYKWFYCTYCGTAVRLKK